MNSTRTNTNSNLALNNHSSRLISVNHTIMPHCHFTGHNLWILKPTSYNRGMGIHIIRDLNKLR